jgi:hypothetical protein
LTIAHGKHYFIEGSQDGRYAVRAKGWHASGLRDTQGDARAYAKN